jgi:riboflavin biosynthesis pyrimidine reductase
VSPTPNAQPAGAGLQDELCLTISPSLVGGDTKRMLNVAALDPASRRRLASICDDDGFLFLR